MSNLSDDLIQAEMARARALTGELLDDKPAWAIRQRLLREYRILLACKKNGQLTAIGQQRMDEINAIIDAIEVELY